MRILFLHPQFPGPFSALAMFLAADKDNKVLFLSERGQRDIRIPKVRRLSLSAPRCGDGSSDAPAREMENALERASVAANALLRLRKDGFVPDIIYASAARGYSFYVRDIFPQSRLVVHAHWFYTKGENYTFFQKGRERPSVDFAPARVRNLLQLNGLMDCDLAITSTQWQKAQYPEELASRMLVIPEGVDCRYFAPHAGIHMVNPVDNSPVEEVVTFSARSREAARGLVQFYSCLPRLLRLRPACHAWIMVPDAEGSDILRACQERALSQGVDTSRVHVIPFMPPDEQRRLLQATTVHVYLTAPFTLSSSLLEAMACGCLVLGSDTPPVREVITDGKTGLLCEFWDSDAMADKLVYMLENAEKLKLLRHAARVTMQKKYNMTQVTVQHAKVLENLLHH